MKDSLRVGRYVPWMPSTPKWVNPSTNRQVPPTRVVLSRFPVFLLLGHVWMGQVGTEPPVYQQPPNFAPVVVPGWHKPPHLNGKVTWLAAIHDVDNVATKQPVIARGGIHPTQISGRTTWLRRGSDQGQSAPNVRSYSTIVLKGATNPHLHGKVWQAQPARGFNNPNLRARPIINLRGWTPLPKGFVQHLGEYAQIDWDRQFRVSQPLHSLWQVPGYRFHGGSVWLPGGTGRSDPPTGQVRLSPTQVVGASFPAQLFRGFTWEPWSSRFDDWDKRPDSLLYSANLWTPKPTGSTWMPRPIPSVDLSWPSLFVRPSWQPAPQGFVLLQKGSTLQFDHSLPALVVTLRPQPPHRGSVSYLPLVRSAGAMTTNDRSRPVIQMRIPSVDCYPGWRGKVTLLPGGKAPSTPLVVAFDWDFVTLGGGWNYLLRNQRKGSVGGGWNYGPPGE